MIIAIELEREAVATWNQGWLAPLRYSRFKIIYNAPNYNKNSQHFKYFPESKISIALYNKDYQPNCWILLADTNSSKPRKIMQGLQVCIHFPRHGLGLQYLGI